MIREMEPYDVIKVCEIENKSFSDPWSYGSFMDDIFSEIVDAIVIEENGDICGYASAWFLYDQVHIANFCVEESVRCKGYGSQLMEYIINRAKEFQKERIILEVRVSNIAAIKLYEKYGFKNIYRRPKFYENNNEDAFIMELKLI